MWRDGNQWSTSPIDKGFEMFDCDREQIQNGEVGVEPEFNDKSDNNKDEDAAKILLVILKKPNKQLLKQCKTL